MRGGTDHRLAAARRALATYALAALAQGATGCASCAAPPHADAAADAAGDSSEAGPPYFWPCPEGWLPAARGGCGPAVLLCEADGGAATPDACPPLAAPPPPDASDPGDAAADDAAAASAPLARTADGGWAGAWPWSEQSVRAGIPACPPDWTRREDGACDPALPASCPAGSGALPGGALAPDRACTATAERDCPSAGEYPDPPDRPAGAATVYVRAGADPAAARGTPELPYATLGAALAASPAGRWVLVAAGTYNESVTVRDAATIVGLCAARVAIAGSAAPRTAAVAAEGAGADLALRGVTVGGPYFGVIAESGARLRLGGARVNRATGIAVLASSGARVELADVLVDDTQVLPLIHAGNGIFVDAGSTLVANRTAVVGSRGDGIFARGARTVVTLGESVVRATTPGEPGRAGVGIEVSLAATLRADRVVVADTQGYGVLATAPGDTPNDAALTASVVRDTAAVAGAPAALGFGACARAEQGGRLALAGVTVERCVGAAVIALDGAQVQVRDALVRDARPGATSGTQGIGLYAQTSAVLSARGVRLLENTFGLAANAGGTLRASEIVAVGHGVGAVSFREGTTLELRDAVVRGLEPGTEAARGAFGLEALSGSALTAERVRVTDSSQVGALASSGQLALTDVLVERVASTPGGTFGRGLVAQTGGAIRGTRLVVADVREMGLALHGAGASAELTDAVIAGVSPSARGFGLGLGAFGGGAVALTRVGVARVAGAAVCLAAETGAADEPPGRASGADVYARGVAPSTIRFDASGTTGMPVGREVAYGLYSGAGASLELSRAVAWQAGFGFLASGARLALSDGVVAGMSEAFGAADGVAPDALVLERVDHRDNASEEVLRDRALPEATTLPLPEPLCPESPCM